MNNREMIEQSLLAQQVYLDIVRRRHLGWAYSIDDPEIKRIHSEIAALIERIGFQYFELLNASHDLVRESVSDLSA